MGRENPRLPFFNDWLVPLRTIAQPRARLGYILDRALAPTYDDWRFAPLPAGLFPLYYLIRPLRLAIEAAPRLTSAFGRPARREARS